MGVLLRIIQVAALCGGVALFALFAYSDPAFPPSRWMLLIGCGVCGLCAMWAATFIIVLLAHGKDAARSLDWY